MHKRTLTKSPSRREKQNQSGSLSVESEQTSCAQLARLPPSALLVQLVAAAAAATSTASAQQVCVRVRVCASALSPLLSLLCVRVRVLFSRLCLSNKTESPQSES